MLRQESATLASQGAPRIYFEQAGDSGDPVVLIPGFTLNHRMWDDQVGYLRAEHEVIAYDPRGFGDSSNPSGPYSHEDDLAKLLEHLNIPSAHLVGLSMGGRIALNTCLKYPGIVRSLTLIDSALEGHPNPSRLDWRAITREKGLEAAKQAWLDNELFDSIKEGSATSDALREMVAAYSGWNFVNEDTYIPYRPRAQEHLGQISVPALVMVGELDTPHFQDIGEILASGITGAEKVIVPDAGHLANLDQPDVCNEQIGLFLGDKSHFQ